MILMWSQGWNTDLVQTLYRWEENRPIEVKWLEYFSPSHFPLCKLYHSLVSPVLMDFPYPLLTHSHGMPEWLILGEIGSGLIWLMQCPGFEGPGFDLGWPHQVSHVLSSLPSCLWDVWYRGYKGSLLLQDQEILQCLLFQELLLQLQESQYLG